MLNGVLLTDLTVLSMLMRCMALRIVIFEILSNFRELLAILLTSLSLINSEPWFFCRVSSVCLKSSIFGQSISSNF